MHEIRIAVIIVLLLFSGAGFSMADTSGEGVCEQCGSLKGQFYSPVGIGIDNCGVDNGIYHWLYIADTGNNRIQWVNEAGGKAETLSERWTQGDLIVQLNNPQGIHSFYDDCAMTETCFVADTGNNKIHAIFWDDTIDEYVDINWGDYGTEAGQFNEPTDLAYSIDYEELIERLYVVDSGNNRVQCFNKTGAFLFEWGKQGTGPGEFNAPHGIGIHGNDVYIADSGNDRIQVFFANGTYKFSIGSSGTGNGQFNYPYDVATNLYEDRIMVTDRDNNRLQLFTKDGTFLAVLGVAGSDVGQFNSPCGIDGVGHEVYIADTGNNRIQSYYLPMDKFTILTLKQSAKIDLSCEVVVEPFVVIKNSEIHTQTIFTDTPGGDPHTAIWEWGDGFVTDGIISSLGGRWQTVNGSHIYLEAGDYTCRVTIHEPGCTPVWADTVIHVHPSVPPLITDIDLVPADDQIFKDIPVTVTAYFTDPDVADSHTATIDWGDGTVTPGEIDETSKIITGTHTYSIADEMVDLTITVTDTGGDAWSGSVWFLVKETGTPLVNKATTNPGRVYGLLPFTATATFTDSDVGDTHIATWYWGDGTQSAGMIDEMNGSVTGTHTYPGYYPYRRYICELVIEDSSGLSGSATTSIVVYWNNAPTWIPSSPFTSPQDVLVNSEFTAYFRFSDSDLGDVHTALIDWGDGTQSEGIIVEPILDDENLIIPWSGNISANHTYKAIGDYIINFTLKDRITQSGKPHNPPIIQVRGGLPPIIQEVTFTCVSPGYPYKDIMTVALFSDPDGGDGYEAIWEYMYSSSPGIVDLENSTITGYHTLSSWWDYYGTLKLKDSKSVWTSYEFVVPQFYQHPYCDNLVVDPFPVTVDTREVFTASIHGGEGPYTGELWWYSDDSYYEIPATIDEINGEITATNIFTTPITYDYLGFTIEDKWGIRGYGDIYDFEVGPHTNHPPILTPIESEPESIIISEEVSARSTFTDPDVGDTHTAIWDWGDGVISDGLIEPTTGDITGSHLYSITGVYTIALAVTDQDGTSDSETITIEVAQPPNSPPVLSPITTAIDPVTLSTEILALSSYSDPDADDSHTATWDWGDGSSSDGFIDPSLHEIRGSHLYQSAGVYAVSVTIVDEDGAADTEIYEFIIVYDPAGGFVTGLGSIQSHAGAYAENPVLSGPATIELLARYPVVMNKPFTGVTAFQFVKAKMAFSSTSYDWLVIQREAKKAFYMGSGKINRNGDYGFLVSIIDGGSKPAQDLFRIKIWDKATGDVIYDTQPGAPDTADPTTPLNRGNLKIDKIQ